MVKCLGVGDATRVGPAVNVVIVAYNSGAVLGRCLEALTLAEREFLSARGDSIAVTIVDNASAAPVSTANLPRDCEIVRLEENVGFAPAANIGANRGRAPLILFLNPDTALEKRALVELANAFDGSDTAIAGPCLCADSGNPMLSERPFHSLRRELLTQLFLWRLPPYGRRAMATGLGRSLTGACLLVARDFFDSVGGFDTAIRMYLEDVELCWMAHACGRPVRFVPTARCAHGRGRSSEGISCFSETNLHLTLLAARVEFVRRRSGGAAAIGMRVVIALGALIRVLLPSPRRSPGRHLAVLRWAMRSGLPPLWRAVELPIRGISP